MEERFISRRTQGLRESLSIFHLLAMVAGLAILSIGAYTFNSTVSRTLSLILLAVGSFVTVISFTAYFGAHIEHVGFLKTYSSTVAILLILELITLGVAYLYRKQADLFGSQAWDFFKENDSKLLFDIEQSLHCCGYSDPSDRPVLMCPSEEKDVLLGGCRGAIVDMAVRWSDWILAAVLLILAVKLTALLTAVVLTVMVERDAEEERAYMTVLAAQNNTHAWYDSNGGGGSGPSSGSTSPRSPVFARPTVTFSTSSGRTGYFYPARPPSYSNSNSQQHQPSQHRVPGYGSTVSTSSHM
ncbi:Tetraspanin family-domain-containing protein [Dichotomocladium elegans]|nr:Tetraspanin family-domain-containing protein [Dichotomocladium elegans]